MLVRATESNGVVTLTLNRPEARNALNLELMRALREAVERVASTPNVRVLILAGEGRSFCAGMDLKGVAADPVVMGSMLTELAETTLALRNVHCPTIAAVQGAAIGGGCGLMVVCDFAVTHADAKLGYPEVDLGISPAVVAPWLVRKIGAGRARAMLLMGGTMSGQAGLDAGLVTHLVAAELVQSTAVELAQRLISGGPKALAATKKWLNELDESYNREVVLQGARLSAEQIRSEEAQSRIRDRLKGV